MRLRNLAAGLALLTTGTIVGVTTQQFASADISSGDRPVLVPIESCRLVDTRPAFQVGPRSAPLGPAETATLDTQQAGTECTGDIPTTASAIAVNVTAPDSTGESFFTLWAEGARPNGSTLNPQAGQLVFNAATVDLADDNSFRVYNNANNVHLIIDVIGYYENHDHDDRYYTEAEVDALLADVYSRAEVDALTPTILTASIASDLSVTRSNIPGISVNRDGGGLGTGDYVVVTSVDVSSCSYVATIGSGLASFGANDGEIAVRPSTSGVTNLFVRTSDSAGTSADRDFHLLIAC